MPLVPTDFNPLVVLDPGWLQVILDKIASEIATFLTRRIEAQFFTGNPEGVLDAGASSCVERK